jgi:hypothetical protein
MNLNETTAIAQSIISRACVTLAGKIDAEFEDENVYRFILGDDDYCVSVYIFENIDSLFEAEIDIFDFNEGKTVNLKLPLINETNSYDVIEDGINFIIDTFKRERTL